MVFIDESVPSDMSSLYIGIIYAYLKVRFTKTLTIAIKKYYVIYIIPDKFATNFYSVMIKNKC